MSDRKSATVKLPYYEFRDGIYEINEFDCSSIFVVIGSEKALVIDTGCGIGNLKWVIENRITDKPYDVVVTHNHPDHIGNAGQFEKIYIHKDDMDYRNSAIPPTTEARREYANVIRTREHKNYDYDIEKDISDWDGEPQMIPITDGHIFHLGNRDIRVFHCPGHTPGEIVLLDEKTRTLICGDAVNGHIILDLSHYESLERCAEVTKNGLQRIYDMRDYYTGIFNGHHDYRCVGSPLAEDVVPDLIKCLTGIMTHSIKIQEIPDVLSIDGGMRKVAIYNGKIVSGF